LCAINQSESINILSRPIHHQHVSFQIASIDVMAYNGIVFIYLEISGWKKIKSK